MRSNTCERWGRRRKRRSAENGAMGQPAMGIAKRAGAVEKIGLGTRACAAAKDNAVFEPVWCDNLDAPLACSVELRAIGRGGHQVRDPGRELRLIYAPVPSRILLHNWTVQKWTAVCVCVSVSSVGHVGPHGAARSMAHVQRFPSTRMYMGYVADTPQRPESRCVRRGPAPSRR